jgi:hypothetical protein
MTPPDLHGYTMDGHIYSTRHLIILLFSKPDYEAERLWQTQLTLIKGRLAMANLEYLDHFPQLRSSGFTEAADGDGIKKQLTLNFEGGHLCFEYEELSHCQYWQRAMGSRESEGKELERFVMLQPLNGMASV